MDSQSKHGQSEEVVNSKHFLLSTGSLKIAESSTDEFWGTGMHLFHKNALDQRHWSGDGAMSEILGKLCQELRNN